MPVQLHLEKRTYGWAYATAADEEAAEVFPLGAHVKASITRAKSRPMLRFYWAVVEEIAEGVGVSKVRLSHELLCATRRIEAFQVRSGETFVVPKRISEMDAFELRDYVNDAFNMLQAEYVDQKEMIGVFKIASAKTRTTFKEALSDLEREGAKKHGRADDGGQRLAQQEP